MKCTAAWSYHPYVPYDVYEKAAAPHIVLLEPGYDRVTLEWVAEGEKCRVYYAFEGLNEYESVEAAGDRLTVTGLKPYFDYKIVVEDEKGRKSFERLFKTGEYPGTVVNYLHPRDRVYDFSGRHTCSPSIVRLESGRLLVSMDIFDGNAPQNLTLVYYSDDEGATWHYLTDIFPCFWGTLFMHKHELYLIGISTEYGDVLIGKGDEEGHFGTPTVLLRGAADPKEPGPHRAPVVIHEEAGRLWTAIEYGSWTKGRFAMGVFSCDAEGDLLDVDNWHFTGFLPYNKSWPNAYPIAGAIEGCVVTFPDGSLKDVMRVGENTGLWLGLDKNDPDALPKFEKFVELPFGHTKFEIRRHRSGKYIAVGNRLPRRTVLSVFVSDDMEHWELLGDVENKAEYPLDEVGFQYPAFIMEGDTLLIAVRSAFNGAENFHDSNFINFYRYELRL